MTDYVVPPGVRIADADRVRLGAHLAEGTTVMHEGFVNFNAGTLGASMVEGRISAGVVVGDGSDIGGGASIMGTLSGGGTAVISIGERCLLGANAGLGISLGDDCIVEAGLYVTGGSRVTLPGRRGRQGGRAERRRRPAVPPQLAVRRDRGAAAQRPLGRPERRAARQRLDAVPARRPRAIASGEVTLAFRRWRRPTVKAGGTLQTPVGLLAIEAVDVVEPDAITDADARRAGFPDAAAVRAALRGRGDAVPDRLPPRRPGPARRAARRRRAHRRRTATRSRRGSRGSTRRARAARGRRRRCGRSPPPPARARPTWPPDSAVEKLPFKADVRKLKALGLTESLERGYRLSPRGRAYLGGSEPRS